MMKSNNINVIIHLNVAANYVCICFSVNLFNFGLYKLITITMIYNNASIDLWDMKVVMKTQFIDQLSPDL